MYYYLVPGVLYELLGGERLVELLLLLRVCLVAFQRDFLGSALGCV